MSDAALSGAFVPEASWIADRPRVEVPGDGELTVPRIERAAMFDLVARLVAAGARHRPSHARVVAALEELGRRLADPASPLRAQLEPDLAHTTGLDRRLVAAGLERAARQLTRAEIDRLVHAELGDPAALDGFIPVPGTSIQRCARAPELLVEILPGNVFAAGITALARALLLRCPTILKPGVDDPLTVPALLHELTRIDRAVTRCVAAWWWRGGDTAVEEPLFASADVVVVHGDDETVERVRGAVVHPTRVVAYGPRVSGVLIAREALTDDLAPLAQRVAEDVVLYDQEGCLSACVVAVEGDRAAAEGFGQALADALAALAERWPPGAAAHEEQAAATSARGTLAMSPGARVWSGDDGGWTVVSAPEPPEVPIPGGRFVVIRSFQDLADLWTSPVDDWAARLQALAVAAPADRQATLALAAARAGVPRVCEVGELQTPPLDWPQDGRPPLGDLLAWSTWERPES